MGKNNSEVEQYSVETANYKTVEVKTEEELELERRQFVEAAEREEKAKAINAKAKRKHADLVFFRTCVTVFALIMVGLIVKMLFF